jgi:hypothetical protein
VRISPFDHRRLAEPASNHDALPPVLYALAVRVGPHEGDHDRAPGAPQHVHGRIEVGPAGAPVDLHNHVPRKEVERSRLALPG